VIELSHFLYFGTVDEVSRTLQTQDPEVRWLVLAGLPEGDPQRVAFDLFVGQNLQFQADVDIALQQVETALLGPDEDDPTDIDPAARTLPAPCPA